MKQNPCPVVGEVAKPARIGFDELNSTNKDPRLKGRGSLFVREGGGCRLSGFLPVQSVYADFYVRDEYWPDLDPQHFEHALAWYEKQDQTLGG